MSKSDFVLTPASPAEHVGSRAVRPPRLQGLIERVARREGDTGARVGSSPLRASWKGVDLGGVASRLAARGILAPEVLAERALAGSDVDSDARALGIDALQLAALYQAAIDELDPAERDAIDRDLAHPRGKGQIGPTDPDFEIVRKRMGVDRIRKVDRSALREWVVRDGRFAFLPRGPIAAVDHRSKLGPARDQGGRGTCTAFGATAVAEAFEALRDRRPPPRDLAEELLFWYSKWGQIYTGGGYDCGVALRHYNEYGVPEESHFSYWGTQISSNHAHVPAPDAAMDRAKFFRQPPVVALPERDVEAVKEVLRSGRCATFASDTHGWNTATGTVSFPDPIDSKGPGASHCTTIIGFVDRDDLPAEHEGGYFIVRNSWGGADSPSHLMGPEYGGHLLMPYGWYRRYSWSAYTVADPSTLPSQRRWRVESYPNATLSGVPARIEHADAVDFDWGSGSPFRIELPFLNVDLGPKDRFSVRCTKVERLRPGWYVFRVTADDAVRVWVDDRLVVNAWKSQARNTYERQWEVAGGDHVLRVEYCDRAGNARVKFEVEPILWHYELYANATLAGLPAATFDDSMTDLEWRHAPPVSLPASRGEFSLRATGRKRFADGHYRFHARHSGGCRMWVDGTLVLDDWLGTNGDGAPVQLAQGEHQIQVEFRHLAQLPAPGDKGYYKAFLDFDWSECEWHASFYRDAGREAVAAANYPHPDSFYEAYRTLALTEGRLFEHAYVVPAPAGTSYLAADAPSIALRFAKLDDLRTGIPGASAIPDDWASVQFRRRVHVAAAGRYVAELSADDGYRLVVDGVQILEGHHVIGPDPYAVEIELAAGVHDVSIEYANSQWGGKIDFRLGRAAWNVQYFADRNLGAGGAGGGIGVGSVGGASIGSSVASQSVDRLDRAIALRPASVGSTNWSLRATRTMWLALGRYRVVARADDGVRVKVGGRTLIDAWVDQPPTTYVAHFEHRGGSLPFEVEYYQGGGGAALSLEIEPDGFLGEYYRGTTLEQPAPGAPLDRTVPIAYRFEPVIDFDFGRAGRLDRIGADDFSARWSGLVDLPVGRWRISARHDDGVRVLLDGRLLIDRWSDTAPETHAVEVDLVGRRYSLEVEYYERAGSAVCQLGFDRSA